MMNVLFQTGTNKHKQYLFGTNAGSTIDKGLDEVSDGGEAGECLI